MFHLFASETHVALEQHHRELALTSSFCKELLCTVSIKPSCILTTAARWMHFTQYGANLLGCHTAMRVRRENMTIRALQSHRLLEQLSNLPCIFSATSICTSTTTMSPHGWLPADNRDGTDYGGRLARNHT